MPNRQFAPKTLIQPWVAHVLSNDALYKDGSPHWHNATTQSEAENERERLCRFLFKHAFVERELRGIAEAIVECRPGNRCKRGPCPECGRAFQRYVVAECETLFRTAASVASIIDSKLSNCEILSDLSAKSLIDRTKRCLKRNGVDMAVGGVDFSFNEDQRGRFCPHWSGHLWLVLPSRNQEVWGPALRRQNPASELAPIPVKIQEWDRQNNALAYALKINFHRRVSVYERKLTRSRTARNTNEQDLRVAERIPLYCYLNAIGLHSRLFLLGARPTMTDRGITFVELRKSVNSSLIAQTRRLSPQIE
jgi:hypothetical protein